MLQEFRRRAGRDAADHRSDPSTRSDSKSLTETALFRAGRLVYGGVLVSTAVDGLRNRDERAQYADAKGVPLPKYATILSQGLLLFGGLGISLWRAPALAASAVVAFFLGTTPTMHDFWSIDDSEQQQQEQFDFLKNTALLGTALFLLATARREDSSAT